MSTLIAFFDNQCLCNVCLPPDYLCTSNYFFSFLQTIKCLLIVPNPESALNEEAGKLLLEKYDDYCRRAKMMTEIHARAPRERKEEEEPSEPSSSKTLQATNGNSNSSDMPPMKRQRTKSTVTKDSKKKTLKRL